MAQYEEEIAVDLSVPEAQVLLPTNPTPNVQEISNLIGPEEQQWTRAIEGIFIKAYATKTGDGKNGKKYLAKKIDLADLVDRTKVVRLTFWNKAINVFCNLGPKIMDRIKFKEVQVR